MSNSGRTKNIRHIVALKKYYFSDNYLKAPLKESPQAKLTAFARAESICDTHLSHIALQVNLLKSRSMATKEGGLRSAVRSSTSSKRADTPPVGWLFRLFVHH